MRTFKVMIAGGCALLLSGCFGMTTDPSQGGLFAYNPEAYQARQQQQTATLNAMQSYRQQTEVENQQLAQQKNALAAEVQQQEKQLRALKSDMKSLQNSIAEMKKGNEAQRQHAAALEKRQKGLQAELTAASGIANTAQRAKLIQELQKELKALEQEAEDLSSL